MKKSVYDFAALVWLMANSCAMAALFAVFSIVESGQCPNMGLAVWLLCLILCYLAQGFFLRQERSEAFVICMCAVFFVLQAVLVFSMHGFFSGKVGTLAAICMWLFSYYSCHDVTVNPATPEKISRSFDLCSLVLVFTIFFCSVKHLSYTVALPLAIATLMCLLALMFTHSGGERKGLSLLISSGIILVFGFAAAMFAALASGGIRQAMHLVGSTLRHVFTLIYNFFASVFRYIASLFPEKHYDTAEVIVTEALDLGAVQDMSYKLIDGEKLLALMIAFGITAAVVLIVIRLTKGGIRAVRPGTGAGKRVHSRQSKLSFALKDLFLRPCRAIAFNVKALFYRNTVQGLYWQLEKRSRAKLHGRAKGESPREFLKRAGTLYPWAEAEIMLLADAMDELNFGSGLGLPAEKIIDIRTKLFKW